MPVIQRTRGGVEWWWVDFRYKGRRIQKRSPTNNKRAAEKYERDLHRELDAGTYGKTKGPIPTIATFSKTWLERAKATHQKHTTRLAKESLYRNRIDPVLGKLALDAIDAQAIHRFLASMSDLSPKTANNAVTALSTLLKLAQEHGHITTIPKIPLAKYQRDPVEFLDYDRASLLVDGATKAGPTHLAMVLLGMDAGLRAGELLALRWGDCDLTHGRLTISRSRSRKVESGTKGGKPRTVPMSARLKDALMAVQHLRSDHVFTRTGEATPATIGTLKVWMATAERRAGMPVTRRLHILRHTFCSHLAMKGAPARVIMELAGHADLTTTLGYMHLAQGSLDAAIALLDPAAPAAKATA